MCLFPRLPAADEADAPDGCKLQRFPPRNGRTAYWCATLPAHCPPFEGHKSGQFKRHYPNAWPEEKAFQLCLGWLQRAEACGHLEKRK